MMWKTNLKGENTMKKALKKALSLCLAMVIVLGLIGCGKQTAPAETESQQAQTPVQSEPPTETQVPASRIVKDVLGREVEIPATIETVACPGMPATRMVVYAGAVDKIVGVTENEKTEMICAPCSDVYHEKFAALPSIGSGWPNSEIYQEELVLLDPNVIVLFTNDPAQADDLQNQTGIPVIAVFATDFITEDFAKAMNFMGDLFGTREHTDALVSFVNDSIEDLDSRTRDIPEEEKPTVYYGAVSFRGYNGIEATYAHYNPFEVIHARNVADETGGNGSMILEKEQVATWDPDIIFINKEGPTLGILKSDFETNPGFYQGLSAVQNGKVYSQGAYNCVYTNIEMSLVNAYYAATIIYPEQFADVDFEAKAAEILTMFLGEAGANYLDMMAQIGLGFEQVTMFN
jgi:iron complex transport system substrate-binding protein